MATSPKSGTASPDDIMAAAAMKPLLMLSKREPVFCALGLTSDKSGVILLHKTMKPKKVMAELRNQAKKIKLELDNATLRFGTAEVDTEVDSALVLFRVNKEAPGMLGAKLREHLKKAGIAKVEFVVDPALEDDAEGEAAAAGPAEPDWPGMTTELATLARTIAAAAANNPPLQQSLVGLAGTANAAIKARSDAAAAAAALDTLRQALHAASPAGGGQPGTTDDPLDLRARLASAAADLAPLKAANDPAFPALLERFAAATASVKAKTPEAGATMDTLEAELARARSAARGRAAGAGSTGKVAYAKLLLRWHDAQAKVGDNLKALGAALLADPEIQADPDFAAIEQGVAELPHLVPELGGRLDDLLDAARDPAADTAALNQEALGVIKDYRSQIAAVGALRELEPFAAGTAAGTIGLFTEFDAALNDLEAALAKAA